MVKQFSGISTIIIPGFMRAPGYYQVLAEALRPFGPVSIYCPPGMLHRRDVQLPPGLPPLVDDLEAFIAQELAQSNSLDAANAQHQSTNPLNPPLILIAHSWASHLARGVAATYRPHAILHEIDPRLKQVVQDPRSLDTYPTTFASKDALVAAYDSYGVAEADIPWAQWTRHHDGRYELAMSIPTLRSQLLDTYPEPETIWPRIVAKGGRKPTVWRTQAHSLNDEGLWRAAASTNLIETRVLTNVAHDLNPSSQAEVGRLLLAEIFPSLISPHGDTAAQLP